MCGLRWSLDKSLLASGGNDNHLCIWRLEQPREPVLNLAAHTAAIKALDWSPHRYSLLASGGGSADRCAAYRYLPPKCTSYLHSHSATVAYSK